ncbi:hypothetical protein BC938DRAFT_473326 [Jimgerdemannia flammicorona]|uniref:Uncharacterized protein n=1 Tax=Jimgerdemannia flammicorona TaxID=994334 RepID=A0A433Q4E8_9FUNG|nr:hypothetical protein BC938DRAFT_473326 [Jimgerdemannia flammicorona]
MSSHKPRPAPQQPQQPPPPAVAQQPPYEPTPITTEAERRQLTEYVRRDAAYQQALDKQHRRHVELANEKKRDIEFANAEKRLRQQPGALPFGMGYEGYGNGVTGKQLRILYPNDRKRPRRTKELKFLSDAIIEQANKEDTLVPIRLEIDGEGYKLRDTFTWNLNETTVTPDHFAEVLCDDLKLPIHSFVQPIAKAIREQVQDFYTHAPSRSDETTEGAVDEIAVATAAEWATVDPKKRNEELRILIKLDITVGNRSLIDQFEWDINCAKNDPEQFAEILATELGLGGEFKYVLSSFSLRTLFILI